MCLFFLRGYKHVDYPERSVVYKETNTADNIY